MTPPTDPEPAREASFSAWADQLVKDARAEAVFGDPVREEGITVVPVATARVAFGGGSGTDERGNPGGGGGGALKVTPVGYLEVRKGRVRYRRIRTGGRFGLWAAILGTLAGVLWAVSRKG